MYAAERKPAYSYAVIFEVKVLINDVMENNKAVMIKQVDTVLDIISERYAVKSVDPEEFGSFSVKVPVGPDKTADMGFEVQQYKVDGYGNLAVMKTDNMVTIMLTPYTKDLPLISVDYMYMGEKRMSYIEFYGLGIDDEISVFDKLRSLTEKYAGFADQPPAPGWFDEFRTMGLFKLSEQADDDSISQMLYDSFEIVMDEAKTISDLEHRQRIAKYKKIDEYYVHLLNEPGVSTAVFNNCMGTSWTCRFFSRVFFGTNMWKP